MKKKKLLLTLTTLLITSFGFSQNVNIPDANFKNALLSGPNSGIDTNNDGEIQVTEAISYTNPIDVTAKNISDLTGIQAFTNITLLACGGNNLTELNVSQNTNLETLMCMYNQIENLNLTSNVNLKSLNAWNNNLKKLNLANGNNSNVNGINIINNPNLKCIKIDNNFTPTSSWIKDQMASYSTYPCPNIAELPDKGFPSVQFAPVYEFKNSAIVYIPDTNFKNALLSNIPIIDTNNDGEIEVNEALLASPYLNVGYKNISDLTGIEAFTNLTTLACAGNNLTNLNVSQNINLEFLYSANNPIKKLSLINNTKLNNLSSWNCNNLTRVDIANGHNTIITTFDVTNSPNLKCIKIDNGFTGTSSWNKDAIARYSFYTCPLTAALPDKEFLRPVTPINGNKINVYPNPSNDYINVENNNNIDIKVIEVYNTNGNKILSAKSSKINISYLKKGIYHLKIITSENEITHKKFIKK